MLGIGFACFALVVFIFFIAVWVVLGKCFKMKPYWLYVVVSIPAFILFVLLAGIVVHLYTSSPTVVFESAFGFAPPADVRIINAAQSTGFDCCELYLQFYADQQTIDKIASQSMKRDNNPRQTGLLEAVDWWKPRIRAESQVYRYDTNPLTHPFSDRGRGFHSEHELLIFDPLSKEAYYRYRGID